MVTHEDKERAHRHLDKAASWFSHAGSATIVAFWLLVGALVADYSVWPGAFVALGAVLTWLISWSYMRAAGRIMEGRRRRR